MSVEYKKNNKWQKIRHKFLRCSTNNRSKIIKSIQDGATPHYAMPVKQFLNETFQEQIERRGTIDWPRRPTDLFWLDFFGGSFKTKTDAIYLEIVARHAETKWYMSVTLYIYYFHWIYKSTQCYYLKNLVGEFSVGHPECFALVLAAWMILIKCL